MKQCFTFYNVLVYIKIYEMALLSGKKDAQAFTDENKLNELEDYLNKT